MHGLHRILELGLTNGSPKTENERMRVGFDTEIVVVGGGIAGFFALDRLRTAGHQAHLIGCPRPGMDQTQWSQGILHTGWKYHRGDPRPFPDLAKTWRDMFEGNAEPKLPHEAIRTSNLRVWGDVDADPSLGPQVVDPPDCLGHHQVHDLEENIIDPGVVLNHLREKHHPFCHHGLVKVTRMAGGFEILTGTEHILTKHLILAAGAGNEALGMMLGRPPGFMQRRPLRMYLIRGALPDLYGHAMQQKEVALTIHTIPGKHNERTWIIGGALAEDAPELHADEAEHRLRNALMLFLPGGLPTGCWWSSYRIDRAEKATTDGQRPDDVCVELVDGVHYVWPTKLVLAPRAADILLGMLPKPAHRTAHPESVVWQQLPELKAVQVPVQDAGLKWRPLT